MKSEFSVGLADKICAAWDGEGGTPVELNAFAENGGLVSGLLSVIRGNAVIKPVSVPIVEVPPPDPLYRKVDNNAISVNLTFSPKLPFTGALVEKHIGEGWVEVRKNHDGLTIAGVKIIFHLSKRQQNDKTLKGYELREELTGKPVLNANILDAIFENQHLIPEDWKKDEKENIRYIFFWGTVYRGPDTDGLCVRYLYFNAGSWHRNYNWLDNVWSADNPAALLANLFISNLSLFFVMRGFTELRH